MSVVTPDRLSAWNEQGFFLVPGFSAPAVGQSMLDTVVAITRETEPAGRVVLAESNIAGDADAARPELGVAKVFKLSRDEPFRTWISDAQVIDIGRSLVGDEVDNFLSQFIFKNIGAWGQPWHQDEWYFPFDRGPQVGLWLAVTEATLDNGCLQVLPGSHTEPVHEHVADRRPGANYGYVEIVDHDMSGAVPVTMSPGDLLVFHSRLMHRSTDNESGDIRAAMVFHLASRGTRDTGRFDAGVNDWIPLPVDPPR